MADIGMPRLSDSMEEGTVLRWLKADGDEVAEGDDLVEIEGDKASTTYEAPFGGVLQIVAPEGETLLVGALIARVGGADEPVVAVAAGPASARARAESVGSVSEPRAGAAAAAADTAPPARVKASPLARRIARAAGLDLAALQGSGPNGRIMRADVEGATAPNGSPRSAEAAPPPVQQEPATPTSAKGATTVQELSRLQQVVARRMSESRATVPDFEVRTRVDVQEVLDLRARLRDSGADLVPSVNDLVVKAVAMALTEHPRANGTHRGDRWELHSRVNVGIAVASEGGLVVPTIFDADDKSVGEIARESRRLAGRVRDGTITPPELEGATFTVSNLGMYGVTSFSAVINAPQAAILSVGAAVPAPVVRDGEIVAAHVMELGLACDHRILYGADAAQALDRIRRLLETPMTLLIG
jgi:pyruvate dehydrogenase E2 component (dihydrolipoamide acetyltransferase)